LHHQSDVGYLHAGYVGAKCVAGPYCVTETDPCPFCESSVLRVVGSQYVAPSAGPNNFMIASMLVAQLLRIAGCGGAGSVLLGRRWTLDLVSGVARVDSVQKSSSCEVCRA
jgi:hypothetical protein